MPAGLVQIKGRRLNPTQEQPRTLDPTSGGAAGEVANRGRIARALLKDRERFVEAVGSADFYRLFWVKFKIIDGCNIKCVMCNHWRRDEYLRSILTYDRLLTLGNELAGFGTRHVNWSGGEPTLRKDLPEIIGHYRSLGIKSSLITNGTRMTEDYARRLHDQGLARALISLESSDPEIHDRVVGSPGAWQKLIDSVPRLSRHNTQGPKLSFSTVLTSINVGPALPGIVALAGRLGVTETRFVPVQVGHLKGEEHALLPSTEQIERLRNDYLPQMLEMGRNLRVAVHVDGGDPEDAFDEDAEVRSDSASHLSPDGLHAQGYYQDHVCYLPWYHAVINWVGDVHVCCHVDSEGLVGNIVKSSLNDILHGPAAKQFRRSLTTTMPPHSCNDCVMQIAENQQIDRMLGL